VWCPASWGRLSTSISLRLGLWLLVTSYEAYVIYFRCGTENIRFCHLCWFFRESADNSLPAVLMSSPMMLMQMWHCYCIRILGTMHWQIRCIFRS
jgi:hypothetical protein